MKIRTYSELKKLQTLEERFEYLVLRGKVGDSTFGFDRYLNQRFYKSLEWKRVRDIVIIRDNGCDLGIPGYEITHKILVHHMNPMLIEDLVDFNDDILNPNYLISTSFYTHQAIHYGDKKLLPQPLTKRKSGDTKLW